MNSLDIEQNEASKNNTKTTKGSFFKFGFNLKKSLERKQPEEFGAAHAKKFDQSCLGEITDTNPNHLRNMYDVFSSTLEQEGTEMVQELNKIVAY